MPKYSDYTQTTTIEINDLIAISRSPYGAGTFFVTKPGALIDYINVAQGGYLEITNAMLSGGNYTIVNPCPSFVFLKVTSGAYTITLPSALGDNPKQAGNPIRFEFDTGATTTVSFLAQSGITQFSTTQAGPIDVDFTTNLTMDGTPWRVTGYVTSIGPGFKTGDVTLTVSDISNAGTMALQNASAVAITGGTGTFNNTGLKAIDVGGSFALNWKPGSTLSANRTLTVTTGDADRTLNLTAGSVTYGALGIANDALATLTQNGVIFGNAAAAFGATAAGTTGQLLIATTGSAPTWAATLAGDFSFTSATSGANRTVNISHSSNTAASNSLYTTTVAGTSAGDPFYSAIITGGATWSWGADNSVSDNFVIAASAALGTTNCFSMTTAGAASFVLGDLDVTRSSSGANVLGTISNTSNSASSSAIMITKVGGTGAADPYFQAVINGGQAWSAGLDNSDGDAFVISSSSALGTTNVMRVATTGEINFPLQSAFIAYKSATTNSATGDGTTFTVVADVELSDQNADYNNGTGTFTAPVTGLYLFYYGVTFTNVGGASFTTQLTTSNRSWQTWGANAANMKDGGANIVVGGSATLVDMDAADTCIFQVAVAGGAKTTGVLGAGVPNTYFSGNLVC